MKSLLERHLAVIFLLMGITACSQEPGPELVEGKRTWEGTCRVCHLNGIAGAPKMGNATAWKPRLKQGEAVLIEHAINGFKGEEGEMPARGGNSSLSDDQVRQAVLYMISTVK